MIIPQENEKDLKEIPNRVKNDLQIVLAEHADEVLRQALILEDPESFLKKPPESPSSSYYDSRDESVGDVVTH